MVSLLLTILLVLLILGAIYWVVSLFIPARFHPVVALVLLIVLILWLAGRL